VIRVLLVDDQGLIRAGFRSLLERPEDIVVVGEAKDGEEGIRLAGSLRPDVVLMDIRMPGLDGLEATRIIAGDERLAGVKVLILTTFESDDYVYEALRSGASGFVVKDTEPEELVQAIRVVARGDALLSPGVTRRLIADIAEKGRDVSTTEYPIDQLTDREREVLTMVGRGLTNGEIADDLVLSPLRRRPM